MLSTYAKQEASGKSFTVSTSEVLKYAAMGLKGIHGSFEDY